MQSDIAICRCICESSSYVLYISYQLDSMYSVQYTTPHSLLYRIHIVNVHELSKYPNFEHTCHFTCDVVRVSVTVHAQYRWCWCWCKITFSEYIFFLKCICEFALEQRKYVFVHLRSIREYTIYMWMWSRHSGGSQHSIRDKNIQ